MSAGDWPMNCYFPYPSYYPTWVYPYWQDYYVHPCPACQPRCPCCGRMLAPSQPKITWSTTTYGVGDDNATITNVESGSGWTCTDSCSCNQGATSAEGEQTRP